MRRSAVIAIAAALALGVGSDPAPLRAQDAPSREWNQPRGDAARSGATAMAPVSAEPTIAWRRELPGTLASEPVTWGGLVHVVAGDDGVLTLLVYHARTGERIAVRRLGKGTWAQLSTWQGRIVVAEKGSLRGFPLKAGKIGSPWRKKGDFQGGACIVGGKIAIRDGSKIKLLAARTGRELAKADWLPKGGDRDGEDAYATLAVRRVGERTFIAGVSRTRADKTLRLHVLEVTDIDGKKPKFGNLTTHDVVKIVKDPSEADRRALILGWLEGGERGGWYVTARSSSGGWNGSLVVDPDETRKKKSSDIVTWPAAAGGRLYGFDRPGSLRMLTADRKERALTERGSLPQGARVGPAAASGGVLCFGNWAMEIESGRTMWVLPDLPPIETVTPVADAFMLLGAGSDLICIAEPGAITTPGDGVATAGAESAPAPPAAGDGVLLISGEKLLGTFELGDDDTIVMRPGADDAVTVPITDVALGEEGGDVVFRGEEQNVLAAWENVLDGVFVRGLQTALVAYRKERLLADSRRLIADMRRYGAGNALLEEYEASLAGKSENPNANMKKKRLGPIEDEARKEALAQVFAAVDWCTERDYGGAATALLAYAEREGVDAERIDALAAARLPGGFPWPDDANAGRIWFTWAKAIVPAGGEFLPRSSPLWKRVRGAAPWNRDTLGLRTKNTLLFSRTEDIAIVGMCLRVGEGTVRALEHLLGKGAGALSQPLDVRLHKDRKEYLEEKTPGGSALPWSAGYFSPSENVSRFYVPDPERSVEPLGRGLSKTLAHELTHHWLSMRWLGSGSTGRGGGVPGYWIVEGFARFIEDQAMEMGRRAGRLDDTTVNSLDACSQVAKQGKLIDAAELVGMTQIDFGKIPEEHVADVELRNTVGNRRLDYRALFYEEAGSLVFFLMNKRGEEGREALIDYMRKHYRGGTPKDPSGAFGFDDGKDMHEKFQAFLLSLVE